ncbi:MAG: NTPase [Candidatus Methanofastidiosum methylothiophilum]|uniref:Probable inosine/xanthosine triphosphatase n=1 Tax=Candidatus Methanofastidiosum methylothiophilum TaxID=1705564 RepID=A0A150IPX7_9EURY|nr:MAG: NTPase [Candidatus Methanofastidiosum methylthiophilus]KYC47010.1 MAG: NTPase [Candidatus Methanofastidiosum methylthiophilus]KYC49373.1 MAG: NTPase [Candidatus Methanofastidiosum methylthiophilus]
MKVLVGSKNPVKIEAAKEAFSSYFKDIEVEGVEVDSSVPDQPIDEEVFEGAEHRAKVLKILNEKARIGSSFFVGIEGGVINIYSKWFGIGVVCIVDEKGNTGFGSSPMFELWEDAIEKVLDGDELGDVMADITGDSNIKRKGGAVGFLTNGVVERKDLYISALKLALIPFLKEELYSKRYKI